MVFLVVGVFFSSPSWAAKQTVQEMLVGCRLVVNPPVQGTRKQGRVAYRCLGMIDGVAGVMLTLGKTTDMSSLQKRAVGLCSEAQFSYGQLAQSYIKWASANPSEWQTEAWLGMVRAFRETWPCR